MRLGQRELGLQLIETTVTSEGRLDLGAAFEASPNPYVVVTSDLRIVAANPAYLEVTNARREDIVGRPMFDAFDAGRGDDAPDNVRQVRASMERARDTGRRDHLAMVPFAIQRRQPDGALVYEERLWSATHTPMLDEAGRVAFLLQHTTDITDLREMARDETELPISALDAIVGGAVFRRAQRVQEANLQLEDERNRLVEMFMQAPGFVAILTGPDHVFQMHNAAYHQLIGHRSLSGLPIREALPELAGQGYVEMLDEVFATGEPYEGRESLVQLQRRPNGPLETVYVNFIYQPVRDARGSVVGIFVQGHDVTESVLATQRQKLMIDELNHRVKNTLATVQSIAIQTARSHADPASFAEAFQARIMALSHTHNLLTRSHWEGADLRAILEHETDAFGPTRISLNGPPVALEPATALSLGMIFHELATNAAKYGALSTPDGRVLIDWAVADQRAPRLTLSWREIDGPKIAAPNRKGFGSRLIERNIRHDLAGAIELVYAPDGLMADLTVPLDRKLT